MSLKSVFLRNIIRNIKVVNAAPVVIQNRDRGWNHREKRNPGKTVAAAVLNSVIVGSILADSKDESKVNKEEGGKFEAGVKKENLPTYTAEEVSKHDNKESFWVTYKYGVYDMTSFLPSHPGGEQIYNAAGLSIEPFWNVYGMHKTDEILQLLESYRIGNLSEADVVEHTGDSLWAREPARDARLLVKTERPFNAETPPYALIEHFDTPNELFYVRQHMPVPELDGDHTLTVVVREGATVRERRFSLQELAKFPAASVRAALMCAGNRRSEMNEQVKPVKGISWAGGAISNARWGGVMLGDVLVECGVDLDDTEGKHIILQGADTDATGTNFSTSIPLHMARQVLLATSMNAQTLPADHGRPLRAVVPGAPAVRSVKWLEKIIISTDESPSHWHQKDYRAFNPSQTWETAVFDTAPPVYSLPVTSAICEPANGDTVRVQDGVVVVRGYAYSGGGAKILRVDVSGDRGRTWTQAEPSAADSAPPGRHYAWTLWRVAVPAPTGRAMEIWVKATDSNFNTQPEKFDDIWNIRGILSNAYHKINIKLQHEDKE